jgi:hypothetical protein
VVAAFFKNVDGDFDNPAAMLSVFLIFCIAGIWFGRFIPDGFYFHGLHA